MVGIKTTGEQISIFCHNGTIFDKPREKTGLAIKRQNQSVKFADAIILVIRVMPMTLMCTEMYLVIKPLDNWKNISRRLETCLSDVSVWMSSTMFRLNQNNT